MTINKLLTPPGKFKSIEDSIPVHSREYNVLVDAVNALQTEEDSDVALKADIASPTFTGVVTIPTPFTLGAVSVTATGTQVNYLKNATGTTGTDTSNVMFSASPITTGTFTCADIVQSGHKDNQTFLVNNFNCPAPGTDWTPTLNGVELGASLTSKKVWVPLGFLKVGDEIVLYRLVGDATEAAALTIDCKLVRINSGDPTTTSDIAGGAIVQIDADGDFDALATLTAAEVVGTDKQYVLEVVATTGVGDSIVINGVEVQVNRK